MKRRDTTLYYILGFGALVIGLAVAQSYIDRQRYPPVGEPAPELRVRRFDGGEWQLSALRGKVVLVDFWARWCEPCVEQMPALNRLQRRLRDRPFVLVSINIEPVGSEEVLGWMARQGLSFPVAQDRRGAARDAYRVSRIPLLVLVGPDGRVRRVYGASASEKSLLGDIEALLPAA